MGSNVTPVTLGHQAEARDQDTEVIGAPALPLVSHFFLCVF